MHLRFALAFAFVVGCSASPPAHPQLSSGAPASQTKAPPSFDAFVGEWRGHGRLLTVRSDGSGTMTWRVYRWCAEGVSPCDAKNGSEIISGGHVSFRLESVEGRVARGTSIATTDSPSASITLTLLAGDMIRVDPQGLEFCGAKAAPSACGA